MDSKRLVSALVAWGMLAAPPAMAEAVHPLMTNSYWANLGVYFAARDFDASARAGVSGGDREIDFESAFGLSDKPELFMGEFGWQFGEKWGLSLQHFESERSGKKVLESSVEWQDVIYDVGVEVRAETGVAITRFVMTRQFLDKGPHSLRLAVGFHYVDVAASLAGEVTIDGVGTEFRRSKVSASAPLPNVGAWYRYSTSRNWLLFARLDWLSARVDGIGGRIWNAAAGVNYSLNDHLGLGLTYQVFELDGSVRESSWRGNLRTAFSGPNLHLSAYW
jgi:hypothetical protein